MSFLGLGRRKLGETYVCEKVQAMCVIPKEFDICIRRHVVQLLAYGGYSSRSRQDA